MLKYIQLKYWLYSNVKIQKVFINESNIINISVRIKNNLNVLEGFINNK